MSGVFISYRRSDAAATSGRIRDYFAEIAPPGRIFHDVGSIDAGEDFQAAIEKALAECEIVLVMIGAGWADPGGAGARLADPEDFVRREVEAALALERRVIPVLIDGAAMPGEADVPESLRPLLALNAFEFRNARFEDDVGRLAETALGRRRRSISAKRSAGFVVGGAVIGLVAYVALAAAHQATRGVGLDASIGAGATMLLFPAFAAIGGAFGYRAARR